MFPLSSLSLAPVNAALNLVNGQDALILPVLLADPDLLRLAAALEHEPVALALKASSGGEV